MSVNTQNISAQPYSKSVTPNKSPLALDQAPINLQNVSASPGTKTPNRIAFEERILQLLEKKLRTDGVIKLQYSNKENFPVALTNDQLNVKLNIDPAGSQTTLEEFLEFLKLEIQKEIEGKHQFELYLGDVCAVFNDFKAQILQEIERKEQSVLDALMKTQGITIREFVIKFGNGEFDEDKKFKEEFQNFIRNLSHFVKNKIDYSEKLKQVQVLCTEVYQTLRSINDAFLTEKIEFKFCSEYMRGAENFPGSSILKRKDTTFIINHFKACGLYYRSVEKLYDTEKNGFRSSEFHRLCDGKGPTIVFVKTKTGEIFGGYTHISWTRDSCWGKDPKSFLFSIDNREIYPVKDSHHAIFGDKEYGPAFGSMGIADNCHLNNLSRMSSHSYNFGKRNLAEICHNPECFEVSSYEVWKISYQNQKIFISCQIYLLHQIQLSHVFFFNQKKCFRK